MSFINATPGDPASFSVNVASTLPVTYQWRFNGDVIADAPGDTLLINKPTLANEGLYTVTVTNALGSVTSEAFRLAIDANGNLMGDTWELQYFGNLNQKPNADFDGDQLTNLEEYENGTNPAERTPYYWIAASGSFDDPSNWNWKRVPGPGDIAFIDSGTFTFGTTGVASKVNLTLNVPYSFSSTTDTTLTLTGTWTLNSPVTIPSGRTLKVTSGTLILNGLTTLTGASLVAEGVNTKFIVNGLNTHTHPNNTNVDWRAGKSNAVNTGCELSFPNLTTITGGVTTTVSSYYFDLIGQTGATLNLPALTSITVPAETVSGSSGVRLYGIDDGLLTAPLLNQFSDASTFSSSWLFAYSGGTLNVPQLTAPYGVQLDMSATNFDFQQFISLERTWFIRLLGGVTQVNIPDINYVRDIIVRNDGTKLTFPNVTSYAQPNNASVEWRAGESGRTNTGCELSFPNLTTITGGVTTTVSSYYFDLIGQTGATLNLPALTSITVPAETVSGSSGVRLYGIDTGTLSAPLLSEFHDDTLLSGSWLLTYSGGILLIPQLTAPYGVQLDISATNFNPQQFVSLERTRFIRLLGGVAQINISNIDYLREIYAINASTKLSFPNVTTYTQANNTNVDWRAGESNRSNVGCELSFPNLTTITGGVTTTVSSYYFDLIGQTGATLNLPALTSITVPAETVSGSSGVRLYALDIGMLNAARLVSFVDLSNPFVSRIEASANSSYRLTSLRQSGLQGVILSGVTLLTGPINLQPPVISSPTSVIAVLGQVFSYAIMATNQPTTRSAAPLPSGLTVNASTGILSGTPAGAGTFFLTLRAENPDGIGTQPLTLIVTPATFGDYLTHAGAPSDQLGHLDDPDHDGLPNLLEYALGQSPMTSSPPAHPRWGLSGTTITFTYPRPRADVSYAVETTDNLSDPLSWTTSGVTQGTQDAYGYVTATIPATGERRFVRLKVTLTP